MIENNLSVNPARQIGSVKPAEHTPEAKENEINNISENRDEYVPGEEKEPIGLYSISPDEDGNPRVSLDNEKSKSDYFESDTTTANTDKVDREIKALRDKEQALRQKLRSADERTAEKIRHELEEVASQLAQKDNDEYRKQNTIYT